MKIPVYEQQVAPQSVGLPVANPRAVDDSGLRAGLASLDRAGSVVMAKQREAEEKAIAAEVTDGETNLTRGITEDLHGSQSTADMAPGRQEGFLSMKGRSAEESSATFMERIEKRRETIANNLKDERAKKLFLARTAGDVENARRTVESHTAQQRQLADVATVKARQDAALEAVRANPNNISDVERQTVALEGPISALGLSPEDREADIRRWHGEVAANQIAAQLERGDWQSAEATLKNKGETLPRQIAKQLDGQIDQLRIGKQAESAADAIIARAQTTVQSRPFASPDRATAEQLLAKLPEDVQKKAAPLVKERLVLLDQQADEDRKGFIRSAHAAYNRNRAGFFATPMADTLNRVDPALYDSLAERAERRLEHLQRKRSNAAEERRRQTEINKVAIQEFQALPTAEQANADIEQFLVNYDTGGVSSEVDPVPSALAIAQKKAREHVEKGTAVSADTFIDDVRAKLQNFAPKDLSTQPKRRAAGLWWSERTAQARNDYNLWLDNHPGKKPTREELDGLAAGVIGELPPNPARPESITDAARALSTRGGGATGLTPAPEHVVIPPEQRKLIEDALRKKNKVITEQAVQALYNQVHGAR